MDHDFVRQLSMGQPTYFSVRGIGGCSLALLFAVSSLVAWSSLLAQLPEVEVRCVCVCVREERQSDRFFFLPISSASPQHRDFSFLSNGCGPVTTGWTIGPLLVPVKGWLCSGCLPPLATLEWMMLSPRSN